MVSSSDSDTREIIAIYLYTRKRRQQRRIRVHEILQQRHIYGEYHHLVKELHFYPDKFKEYFRMTEQQFDHVIGMVEDDIRKLDTTWGKAISPRERLAICLRFLATGDSYKTIGFSYRVGVATISTIVREVCEAIWTRLQPDYVSVPSSHQWLDIAKGYEERWNFPSCLGALDGKHVLIQAPPNSGSLYFNYKKTFSVVLLALVDHRYRFTVVDIGSYGSNSDAGIFRRSALFKKLQNDTLGVAEGRQLFNGNDLVFPYVIIGDEAFPLLRNLMRPFPGTGLDDAKRIFNYRLSSARRLSENAFGILANKWRVFHRKIPLSPQNANSVVKATIVLHNMLQTGNDAALARTTDVELEKQYEDIHECILRPIERTGRRPRNEAMHIRDVFKEYFVSPQGAVAWQTNAYFGQAR